MYHFLYRFPHFDHSVEFLKIKSAAVSFILLPHLPNSGGQTEAKVPQLNVVSTVVNKKQICKI